MLSEIIETVSLPFIAVPASAQYLTQSSDLDVLCRQMLKVEEIRGNCDKTVAKLGLVKDAVLVVCLEAQREVRGSSTTIRFLDKVIKRGRDV